MGRGIAALGVAGEESTEKMVRGLIKVQGAADFLTGTVNSVVEGFRTVKGVSEALQLNKALGQVAGKAGGSFLGTAAGSAAGGAAGGAAAGSGLLGGAAAIGTAIAGAVSAALGGFAVGKFASTLATGGSKQDTGLVKAMARLSEATGISVEAMQKFGGPVSFAAEKMLGLGKSADELVAARKRLSKDESERSRRDQILKEAQARQELITQIHDQAKAQRQSRRDADLSTRDRLEAQRRFRGDSLRQQFFINQQLGRRTALELKDKTISSERREELLGRLAGAEEGRLGLISRFAGAERGRREGDIKGLESERQRQVSSLERAGARLGKGGLKSSDRQALREEIAKGQERLRKIDVDLKGKRQLLIRFERSVDEEARVLTNQVNATLDAHFRQVDERVVSEVEQRLRGEGGPARTASEARLPELLSAFRHS